MRGILLISHAKDIVIGLQKLLDQVAKDVPISICGGLEDGSIGTSFDDIANALAQNPADELYAFYDLGSAKLNLDMAIELSDKKVTVYEVPLIEGSYVAAAYLQAGVDDSVIDAELSQLRIRKA